MDHEMAFPNPVERTDLPVPRRKWKYALALGLVLFAILFALLPQILSSKIGRNILKAYLENKFRGEAFITEFRTSWSGPTVLSKFAFNDPESRQVRILHLSAPIGVLDLLRGNFNLDGATIQDLYVDYVVDYGDGTDTMLRLNNKTIPGPNDPVPPVSLPNVHGKVNLTNALIVLSRGSIEQKSQFRTTFRTMRFANVEGTLDVASLDQPFTCDLRGTVGGEGNWGTFTMNGTVDLGEDGQLDLAQGAADLKVSMQNVPNHVGHELGSLLWIFVPTVRAEHFEQMFGNVLTRLDMDFKIGEGKLRFDRLDVQGRLAEDKFATLSGKPVLDLVARPHTITSDGDIKASVRLSRGLAESLAYVNPFFIDAVQGAGEVDLVLSNVNYPLRQGWWPALNGTVTARDVTLVSGQVLAGDRFPRELTTQWQAVVGNTAPAPKMQMPPTPFTLKAGFITTDIYPITIDEQPLTLSSNNALNGRLRTQATVTLTRTLGARSAEQDNTLHTTVSGSIAQPQLELPAATATAMASLIDQNVEELRARKAEMLLQKSQHQVEQLLSGFERMKRLDDARGVEAK